MAPNPFEAKRDLLVNKKDMYRRWNILKVFLRIIVFLAYISLPCKISWGLPSACLSVPICKCLVTYFNIAPLLQNLPLLTSPVESLFKVILRGNFACFPHTLNEKPLANSSCKLPFLIEYLNNEKSLLLPRAEAQILHYWCYQGWFQTMTSPITQFVFPLSQNFQILSGGWGSHFFFEVLHSVKKKNAPCSLTAEKTFLTAKWKALWKCDHENVAGIACHNVHFKQKRNNNNKSKAAVRQNITATNKVWTCELKTSID